MKFILPVLLLFALTACNNNNTYKNCQVMGYEGIVLNTIIAEPYVHCSDGRTGKDGKYFMTNTGDVLKRYRNVSRMVFIPFTKENNEKISNN